MGLGGLQHKSSVIGDRSVWCVESCAGMGTWYGAEKSGWIIRGSEALSLGTAWCDMGFL